MSRADYSLSIERIIITLDSITWQAHMMTCEARRAVQVRDNNLAIGSVMQLGEILAVAQSLLMVAQTLHRHDGSD